MEEETDPLDPKTVFTIKHSDIPKGITQCVTHTYTKLSETEVKCGKCQSAWIVNPDVIDSMLQQYTSLRK